MFEPNVRKTRGTWAVPAWARQLAVGRSPAWGGAGWGAGPAANSGCPILRKPKCWLPASAHVHWLAHFQRWWCRWPFPSAWRLGGWGRTLPPFTSTALEMALSLQIPSGQNHNCPADTHWCLYQIGHVQLAGTPVSAVELAERSSNKHQANGRKCCLAKRPSVHFRSFSSSWWGYKSSIYKSQ